MISVTCFNCGKEFEAKRSSAKFCSDNCRVSFARHKGLKEPAVVPIEKFKALEEELNQLKSQQNQNKAITAPKKEKVQSVSITEEIAVNGLEMKHPLWKEDDPSENTFSFYRKYDCMNYEELSQKLKNQ